MYFELLHRHHRINIDVLIDSTDLRLFSSPGLRRRPVETSSWIDLPCNCWATTYHDRLQGMITKSKWIPWANGLWGDGYHSKGVFHKHNYDRTIDKTFSKSQRTCIWGVLPPRRCSRWLTLSSRVWEGWMVLYLLLGSWAYQAKRRAYRMPRKSKNWSLWRLFCQNSWVEACWLEILGDDIFVQAWVAGEGTKQQDTYCR